LLDSSGSPYGEDPFFSLETIINQFYRVDIFGPTEEDVCVHGAPAFLPDELNADIATIFIRRDTPAQDIVAALQAATNRAEEGLE
jgi:hypothetical protein